MSVKTITLAGREIPINELNFAQLKRILPAINRAARAMASDRLDEAAMDDMGIVLCSGTGMAQAELDALPIRGNELGPAFEAIVKLAGLGPAEGAQAGEAWVASDGTGTNSMPTSPPALDGHG